MQPNKNNISYICEDLLAKFNFSLEVLLKESNNTEPVGRPLALHTRHSPSWFPDQPRGYLQTISGNTTHIYSGWVSEEHSGFNSNNMVTGEHVGKTNHNGQNQGTGDNLQMQSNNTKRENPLFKLYQKTKPKKRYPEAAMRMFASVDWVMKETGLLMEESRQVMNQRSLVDHCLKDLESLCQDFKAYPVGSRVLGLAGRCSDLDIFLDNGDMFLGNDYQDAHSQSDFVYMLERLMMRNRNKTWRQIIKIPCARTPIVTVRHHPTGLQCDISQRHGLGCENTAFLSYMMEVRPVMRPLILILKKWLVNAKLSSQVRNFALSIMVLFYLQVRKFLPSIAWLRAHCTSPPNIISGWECHYSQRPEALRNIDIPPNYVDLLHGFFLYYSKFFDFDKEVICPLMGKTILKSQFEENGAQLPEEMNTYKNMVSLVTDRERLMSQVSRFIMDHPCKELFRYDAPMCIQDPFDLSHNLAKAVSKEFVVKFKNYCEIEAQKCETLKRGINFSQYEETFWNN